MSTSGFERTAEGRIRIHVLPTKRFKTFAVSLYAGAPLAEETVTPIALTPFVLRRGNASYPETMLFRERLEELYGAGFGFDVYKRDNSQIVQFRMDTINDAFVSTDEPLLESSLAFLGETLTRPALENGVFKSKFVDAERDNVRKKLDSIINNKARYAGVRCVEEMFAGESYRLNALGKREALEHLDAAALHESYRQWLSEATLDLYVVGDTTLDEVRSLVHKYFDIAGPGHTPHVYEKSAKNEGVGNPHIVKEVMDVSQGKLNIGFKTSIDYSDDRYASALVYNGILGGYPHSKLFQNVREKASLAYYASSQYEPHKAFGTIQSGIEISNYDRALDIIRVQLDAMKAGEITETELRQTQAMLGNDLREIRDSAFQMIHHDFGGRLSGRERNVSELIQQVEQMTSEQVAEAAQNFRLDTIYFLTGKEGE
ncbi:EF-P 5-aminopentanol modification-associated protein YfmF [Saccharibacillus sp. JS10]|uniref:EF-P 5-aminopentanol modification-associated protein YfmF n=1 Tax=Saccharibacillus sp. JS10 TaxID=2950552 RepID=UPI00210D277F|nr:pitrilysin family protein [Saccharibacillus sp. JS10]MCQ4087247.1 insulinase family protein [Saccharibacillus sp. JS10]